MQKTSITRRRVLAGMTAVPAIGIPAFGPISSPALAQAFPSKPIRIVVGFAPGGLTDVLARLLGPTMQQELGQPVVIENKAGASGNLATEMVAKSAPDGHTLLFSNISQIVVNTHAYASMPVNPVTDLAHIAAIAEGDLVMAVHPGVPANTVAEFVRLAKAEPGKMNYFTSGAGGLLHVAAEIFKMQTGTDIKAVHYRGSGASIPEFLAGQTQMGIEALPVLEQHIKAGRVKALMIPAPRRSSVLPDVPTSAEAGYPQLLLSAWFGLHAPRGTPAATLGRINAALTKAIRDEQVQSKLVASGMAPIYDTPEKFTARIMADDKIYGEAIRATKIRIE